MATTVTLKPNAIDLSGSTSGTTTLQATAVAGTTTITLPAATDTLVGKATTDTLTNKTLTTPVISTISNTGTLTLPTSTDTLVGRATTDTLTNKTLTTPVISSLSSASATALTLQSAGTTAITVDTSQNVGIGTASPAVKLDVNSSAAGGNICVFRSTATNGGYVQFQGSGSTPTTTGYVGAASKLNTGGSVTDFGITAVTNLVFGTSDGTERMRLNTTGALVLAGGSTSASGIGIAFPATQSASSDANTLDDYEEGTWTPTFAGGTTNPTVTYSYQYGYYTKIGNLVYLTFRIGASAYSGGSGSLQIKGMPFSASSQTNNFGVLSLGYANGWTTSAPTYGRYTGGNNFMELYYLTGPNETTITTGLAGAGTQLIMNIVYQAA